MSGPDMRDIVRSVPIWAGLPKAYAAYAKAMAAEEERRNVSEFEARLAEAGLDIEQSRKLAEMARDMALPVPQWLRSKLSRWERMRFHLGLLRFRLWKWWRRVRHVG